MQPPSSHPRPCACLAAGGRVHWRAVPGFQNPSTTEQALIQDLHNLMAHHLDGYLSHPSLPQGSKMLMSHQCSFLFLLCSGSQAQERRVTVGGTKK
ncbi:hypothetical protein AAFF_G00258690 [Aldrovandia affinis]|uniref:Uncharacterized protein n=1 Tax=Aldrovandia affinis TaxID=143900 RepID=A0AAD7STG4_9TELE|nr:hypothetical protein AAFF_G00258690 [Aldrovandia affinis]